MVISVKNKSATHRTARVSTKKGLLLVTVGLALMTGHPTWAQTSPSAGEIPFMITVDGQIVDESGGRRPTGFGTDPAAALIDRQRRTDVDLSAVDIQIKFDGLEVEPLLNVSTSSLAQSYEGGDTVSFLATSNYPAFIERAEIRIQASGSDMVHTVPVAINGQANWRMPVSGDGRFHYVLRVYDADGRFDETEALSLTRTRKFFQSAAGADAVAPGMGEDRTAVRNIPVYGGSVTVFGRNVPPGYDIAAFGEQIPVDANRSFVAQRILPPGEREIDVAVNGTSKGGALNFRRSIDIPENQWFYVGLVDLTVGQRSADANIETVREGEYDDVYTEGRVAFYLKGKIRGRYLLTASADVDGDSIDDILGRRDANDPRDLLRRIDPDAYYPVYGDDSTIVDDAPTDGSLFVRLERGDSHVMWGTYNTRISGSEFIRSDRQLYGASAVYRSEDVVASGERRTEAVAYASQPETLPQNDEFLATGGSSYFMRRRNLALGSETLTVEVRDDVTGRVLSRQVLSEGADYTINLVQGLVLLKRPLAASVANTDPVRDGALGSNVVYLIAQYEYFPLASDIDTVSHGGRVQHWVNDDIRVGVSEASEQNGDSRHQAVAADVLLRRSDATYIEVEVGQSEGTAFGASRSTNGGLSFSDETAVDLGGETGAAVRVEGAVGFEDLGIDGLKGQVGGYYEQRDANFSTLTQQTLSDQELTGANISVSLSEDVELQVAHDQLSDDAGQLKQDTDVNVVWTRNEQLTLSAGVSRTVVQSPIAIAAGKSGYDGESIDAGVRADYQFDEDREIYAFGQGTIRSVGDIADNSRVGVGGEMRLTDKITASAELSTGETGFGALAALSYAPTANDRYYVGYRLDPDRQFGLDSADTIGGDDNGVIVAGARRQLTKSTAIYAEQTYDMLSRRRSLTETYGVTYTPNALWTIDGGVQIGSVNDATIDPLTGLQRSDFDRSGVSIGASYDNSETGLRGHVRGEVISDRSDDGTRDGETYLFDGALGVNTNENWRLFTGVQAIVSEAEGDAFEDGEFVEASAGFAYRPVDNGRLNALFRYTFLYDDHQADQIDTDDIRQRSHILSVDTNYDIIPTLSIGAKYGLRLGETSLDDTTEWSNSEAHLAIVRADFHVLKTWDLLVEGRMLSMPSADTVDYGVLTSIHRHVGDHLKFGLGYNFGRFSDDLRDQVFDDEGFFVNLIAKF